MREPVVFRSRFGQILTIAIVAVGLFVAVSTAISGGILALVPYLPALGLVCVGTVALYWLPSVTVTDGSITLRNVLRTIELPWPSIGAVETRFALTLVTSFGTYTAWAAPAPGRFAVMGTGRDTKGLPESTFVNKSIRPGDDTSTDSGQAALIVRLRWEALQRAGYLDEARLETERPRTQWHWVTISVLAGLLAATIAAFILA